MNHIEAVKAAIGFLRPDHVPLELVDVPGIYDAYATLDPDTVRIPPGAESFDSLQATYHWTCHPAGVNSAGERLRRDEWGCLQRVPAEHTAAYQIIERPLGPGADLRAYDPPSPECARPYFRRIEAVIRNRYWDRFVCGYIDPGPLLVAFNLMGYDGLLQRLMDDLPGVLKVLRHIVAYQSALVTMWAKVGAHMVCVIDEFAGSSGMMFSPQLWRAHLKPLYQELFRHIRSSGLYAGVLFDGDISALLDDVMDLCVDVLDIRQPNLVGIETYRECFRGRLALKASVDMMTTLATGTPDEARAEAERLARELSTPDGGFIGLALRWHRPEYPEANVAAAVEGFKNCRGHVTGDR